MDATRTATAGFVHRAPLRPAALLRRLRDPSPPVAGLLIDLCGVLYDDSAWPRWLFKLVQHLGLHTNYTPFFRVWRREYLERVKRGDLEYWQALALFLRAAGLSRSQVDEVTAAGHARLRFYEDQLLPLPGVSKVLLQLQQRGVRMTLFSSAHFSLEEVRRRIAALGLDTYFSDVWALPDLHADFPQRAPLEVAADHTHLDPTAVAFVGRDAAMLAQAGAVGVRRIAVNHDDDAVADVFLRSIDRLPEAVVWDRAEPIAEPQ